MNYSRINDKIIEIEKLLSELENIMPSNIEQYLSNFEKKAACERYFERIIEASVDLAFLIIKTEKLKIPSEDTEAFFILAENKIIDKNLAEKFRQAKGMRNILAHEYGKVDDELVFEALTNEILSDVKNLLNKIKSSLNKK